MLTLSTLWLSTLHGAGLLQGRSAVRHMPRVRCSLASDGEAFLVPDASVPCVVFEDDQIAVVAKPGSAPPRPSPIGRLLTAPVPRLRPAGARVSLLDWALGNVARSTATDALEAPEAVTPLSDVVGGLVPLAKTAAAAACLRAEVRPRSSNTAAQHRRQPHATSCNPSVGPQPCNPTCRRRRRRGASTPRS